MWWLREGNDMNKVYSNEEIQEDIRGLIEGDGEDSKNQR